MSNIPAFDALGLPAPLWLLFGLKVFGFWVHMIFMNLWFAGIPIAMMMSRMSGNVGESGTRLMRAMPIFIAFGINAGIVPLLFLQVLYPQFFYTTTTLQAWPWFAIVPLVLIAYYGVYTYVLGVRSGSKNKFIPYAGWLSALVFVAVGVIFVSQMQLLTRTHTWLNLATGSVAGAVSGAHFTFTGAAFTRFLMMFGMAFGTTATWLALDANFFKRDKLLAEEIKIVVLTISVLGALFFAMGASAYSQRIYGLATVLGMAKYAAAGPALVVAAGVLYFLKPGKLTALLMTVFALASLLGNAIARQIIQYKEISRVFDLRKVPVNLQVSPVVLFLASLVVGIGVCVWLVATFIRASRAATPSEPAAAASAPAAYR